MYGSTSLVEPLVTYDVCLRLQVGGGEEPQLPKSRMTWVCNLLHSYTVGWYNRFGRRTTLEAGFHAVRHMFSKDVLRCVFHSLWPLCRWDGTILAVSTSHVKKEKEEEENLARMNLYLI